LAEDLERARLTAALVRVARQDRRALEEVYQRTSAKLFGVIVRILRDRQEAEDVLQEVYLTVWRRADSFDPSRASPITWLVSVARNRAIDRLRSSAVRPTAPIEAAGQVADPTPSALASVERDGEYARLAGCIDALDPKHAQAIRTAFFEGVTYEVLAKAAGAPLGTMKSWIRRSLISLRACLES